MVTAIAGAIVSTTLALLLASARDVAVIVTDKFAVIEDGAVYVAELPVVAERVPQLDWEHVNVHANPAPLVSLPIVAFKVEVPPASTVELAGAAMVTVIGLD